jgi:para-nitrobenzyl esterase
LGRSVSIATRQTASLPLQVGLLALLALQACAEDPQSDAGTAGRGGGCAEAESEAPGVVATRSGLVQGKLAGRTWTWQGIPYALPPTGPLRFAPPADVPCWDGTNDATVFGPACIQRGRDGEITGIEDCLTLNVWAPDAASSGSGLPVLVFVHGGGHQQGSASQELVDGVHLYDGQRFVERSGAILVTVEYRLGPFGFLAHPALTAERPEKSGNYGMLDQIAALRWVRDNIARFGGDPDRVLVFGESAGAVSTCRLVASSLAAGLFSAAIVESGACTAKPLADAESNGVAVAEAVGCASPGDAAACLRNVGAEALIATVPPLDELSLRQGYDGVIDGHALSDRPLTLIETGQHNAVPVIIGSNTEELGKSAPALETEAEYEQAVRAYAAGLGVPQLADALLTLYPASDYASPRAAYVALTSDVKFTCPARKALRAFAQGQSQPAYRYVFSHVADQARPAVKALGATHGLELAFVFDVLPNPGPGDEVVTAAFAGYWSRMAGSGNPNDSTATQWPEFDLAGESYLHIESPLEVGSRYRTEQCEFFESLTQP